MSSRTKLFLLAALWLTAMAGWLGWFLGTQVLPRRLMPDGWGVDACLSIFVGSEEFADYSGRLHDGNLGWLRERLAENRQGTLAKPGKRGFDGRERFAALHAQGYRVDAFADLPFRTGPRQPGNQLAEDLREVFAQGKYLGSTYAGLVDAWEMVGEPDVGYCLDLPERTVAYQKALYLGIKAGTPPGRTPPIVLMGALGLPPSPWLDRAVRNGLLDYTDAYNFHFYGYADAFDGTLAAHRAVREAAERSGLVTRRLPFWLTESGLDAMPKHNLIEADGRRRQAEFTLAMAAKAVAAPDLAVFMPFILVHPGDPYALTLSSALPLPAWDAYARFTREHPWGSRILSAPPAAPNPVVVQWLPDNITTQPRKVGGTYRFIGAKPIRGQVFVYNFGPKPVTGRLTVAAPASARARVHASVRTELPAVPLAAAERELVVPANGRVMVPVEFERSADGYFREDWELGFAGDDAKRSVCTFGLEAPWSAADWMAAPLTLRPGSQDFGPVDVVEAVEPGAPVGVWQTANGLAGNVDASGTRWNFWLNQPDRGPVREPMAQAAVDGLPADGVLRLTLSRPLSDNQIVRLILVDDRGYTFTIWENIGADYHGSMTQVDLHLQDFHPYARGRVGADYRLHPERVRQVLLRFYFSQTNWPVAVSLGVLRPRR